NSKPSSSKAEDSKPDISSTSSSSLPLSSSSHDTNSTIWINHHLNPNSNNPERNMADNQPSGEASQLLSSLQTITESSTALTLLCGARLKLPMPANNHTFQAEVLELAVWVHQLRCQWQILFPDIERTCHISRYYNSWF
ncbi:hypothetical protein PCASD_24186, partial [Puccinia coronata f. sp. avenae]